MANDDADQFRNRRAASQLCKKSNVRCIATHTRDKYRTNLNPHRTHCFPQYDINYGKYDMQNSPHRQRTGR